MANPQPEFVYWDACVVQSYLEKTSGRWPTLESLLRASYEPTQPLQLVTSPWTIAEVAYLGAIEKDYERPEAYLSIQALWDSEVIKMIEFHELIGHQARDIVRKSHFGGWTIKPKDAVHLASALARGAVEFHTYDGKFAERMTEHYGLKAGEPSLLRVRSGTPLRPVETVEQAAFTLEEDVFLEPQRAESTVVAPHEKEPEAPE